MLSKRWNCYFFQEETFSPAPSSHSSVIDHQNIDIMAALVKAPLSQWVNITLKQGGNNRIFLLLPCTKTEVFVRTVFASDISSFSDTFGLPSKYVFFFYENLSTRPPSYRLVRLVVLFMFHHPASIGAWKIRRLQSMGLQDLQSRHKVNSISSHH